MTKCVFAVYDSKAEYYKNPFLMSSKGEAIRAFSDLANDLQTEVGKHPEDFTLFYLGTWDEITAKYSMSNTLISLGVALEYKKSNEDVGRDVLSKVLPIK